ncbi:MAG: pectin acetylesterase-family hydrolase [Anaerolineae bacterium]
MRRVIWAAMAVLVLTGFRTDPDAGAAPTAGTEGHPWAVPPLEAVVPDALGWDTIHLEGATCGRGAPFAYFLNPAPDPDAGLFIWLMGGGACLKDGLPPPGAAGIARQLHCMTYTNFAGPTDAMHLWTAAFPYFRRVAANPYADYTWVFVPYCTGDIHAGQMTDAYDYDPSPDATFDVVHRGHLNVVAVLDDVARRYSVDRHVVLTGSSAGGFGAIFNFPEAMGRWPSAVLLPDAGIAPPVEDSLMAREGERVAARWGTDKILPDYCATQDCLADTMHLLAAHAAHYDGRAAKWRPFGYLQGQQDGVLADYLEISRCSYEMGLRRGFQDAAGLTNLRAYLPATSQHTFLAGLDGYVSASGVQMLEWFAAVAGATDPGELPADAVDPWLACNPVYLPRGILGGA